MTCPHRFIPVAAAGVAGMRLAMAVFFLAVANLAGSVVCAEDVLTQHNDNSRTGANLSESILNTSNVSRRSFGKLFERAVDGAIFAQPLYVSGVRMPGGKRNVVYVATMHNSVYAFDADDPAAREPLWTVSLGPSVSPQDPNLSRMGGYQDIPVEIGITSTPVISVAHGAIYLVPDRKPSHACTDKGCKVFCSSEDFWKPVVYGHF